MKKVCIWLDDMRDPLEVLADPDYELVGVFFDNDLGSTEPGTEGRHAFTWFEGLVRSQGLPRMELVTQTANPAARREFRAGFNSLRRHWALQEVA